MKIVDWAVSGPWLRTAMFLTVLLVVLCVPVIGLAVILSEPLMALILVGPALFTVASWRNVLNERRMS